MRQFHFWLGEGEMGWLWRLLGVVPREEWGGLALPDEDARRIRYRADLAELFRVISEWLPEDAILYLEGVKDRTVEEFLKQHPAGSAKKIQVGTIWPAAPGYHLENRRELVERMIEYAERLATPEIADHLVVYRGETVLVSAYDLGDPETWISRGIEAEVFEQLLEGIGGSEE